jgi:dTDP-4-amino-4,6-dideoxygalactose transaminase
MSVEFWVPMTAFGREPADLLDAQMTAVQRTIRSGWWILGKEVQAFEASWAQFCGSSHAVGVGNGMDALEIGLRALQIGPGDEVITTPMTAFATVLAILRAGATPVLADIDRDSAILDPRSVERCVGPKTKAVLLVHLYGQAAPMDSFLDICHQHSLLLFEDCAQAHGARWNGKSVGTFGCFASWSFYPTKNLGAIGDAGALTTESPEIAAAAACIRNYGQSVRYQHPEIGINSRLDEIQAAILQERLAYLPEWTRHRRRIAARYAQEIRNPLVRLLPLPVDPLQHVHHLFVVATPHRDALMQFLREHRVESLIHYPLSVENIFSWSCIVFV